jgi:hypothetical protein
MFGRNRAKLAFGTLPTLWIAANEQSYTEWMKHQQLFLAGTPMGPEGLALIMSGNLTFVQPNVGVEVVQMKGDRACVKVQEGEHSGIEGWVPMAFLKK